MQPFTVHTGVAAPLIRANVDTDAIIPSREMTGVSRQGLAQGLFAGWRYREIGGRAPDPAFVLNDPAYAGATILLGGENFGCGSSREHAVWALAEYGFRAIVAASFSPIFQNNCVRNGLLPIVLDLADIEEIARRVAADPQGRPITADLRERRLSLAGGPAYPFQVAEASRTALLEGLDEIAATLRLMDVIQAFRAADRRRRPWAYLDEPAGDAAPRGRP
jgi:3-isopropylmalate/(R)-2-methylmalate dehydratase small subunit